MNLFAVVDKHTGVYGHKLTTGEECLALYTSFDDAWRVTLAPGDSAVLELTPDAALVMLEEARVGSRWNRVSLNPTETHVSHKSFSEAMDWIRRTA